MGLVGKPPSAPHGREPPSAPSPDQPPRRQARQEEDFSNGTSGPRFCACRSVDRCNRVLDQPTRMGSNDPWRAWRLGGWSSAWARLAVTLAVLLFATTAHAQRAAFRLEGGRPHAEVPFNIDM